MKETKTQTSYEHSDIFDDEDEEDFALDSIDTKNVKKDRNSNEKVDV